MKNKIWLNSAMDEINADYQRSADTHLIKFEMAEFPGITMYLKDESSHPTGSLKHRLARSLFLYGLCNGWIKQGTTVIEASSGSTAVSEAWFARLLGLPFIAVVPASTARRKIELIEFYGGRCEMVRDPREIYSVSEKLAQECKGHFMNQFKYAERATDWRGNNNIGESIIRQMAMEKFCVPHAIIMSAGTGGTLATLGRYVKLKGLDTEIIGVDPENSVFYDFWKTRNSKITLPRGSKIEGIGRPRVEPSFVPTVIDSMLKVPDTASGAAMRLLHSLIGKKVGPSTGTNFIGLLAKARAMRLQNEQGSLVSLICDGGERYEDTWYDDKWVETNIGSIKGVIEQHL